MLSDVGVCARSSATGTPSYCARQLFEARPEGAFFYDESVQTLPKTADMEAACTTCGRVFAGMQTGRAEQMANFLPYGCGKNSTGGFCSADGFDMYQSMVSVTFNWGSECRDMFDPRTGASACSATCVDLFKPVLAKAGCCAYAGFEYYYR